MTRPLSKNKPKGFWKDVKNVRKYLSEYAEEQGFDPSIQKNWNHITATQIIDAKVTRIQVSLSVFFKARLFRA